MKGNDYGYGYRDRTRWKVINNYGYGYRDRTRWKVINNYGYGYKDRTRWKVMIMDMDTGTEQDER